MGVLPASEGLVLSGTMGLRTTYLAWGANLPWNTRKARRAKGAWHASVPLLTLGTAVALPREQYHSQNLGTRSLMGACTQHLPSHTPLWGVLTSLPGSPVSPLSP